MIKRIALKTIELTIACVFIALIYTMIELPILSREIRKYERG